MNNPRGFTSILRHAIAFLLLATGFSGSAQYAWFARSTDTIAVSGQTELGDQCTIEAIFLLPSSQHSGGNIFNEWVLAEEEKYLAVSSQSIGAVAYPNNYLEAVERRGLISLDRWHHVAFVCNGVEQRLYLDGLRIEFAPALQKIANAAGTAFIGYAPREGSDQPSMIGFMDSVRVSKIARYSGLKFTPPTGDLPSDEGTVLLYNFNDPSDSTTVVDESPLARTGTLGTGFIGATSPKLINKLPTAVPLGLQIFTAVELQFSTSLGARYQIQTSPDTAVWTDLPELITGDGNVVTKLISSRANERLFYRIVTRP